MFEEWQSSDFEAEFYMDLLRAYFNSANDAIFVLCDEMKFLACNEETQRWLGQSEKELTHHNQRIPITQLLGNSISKQEFSHFFQKALGGDNVTFEAFIKPENARARWTEINMTRVKIDVGDMIIGIARDISERKKHLATIEYQTYFDSLTDLPNKNQLNKHLIEKYVKPEINSLTLFTLNLDRFKEVNETLGQSLGDMVLQEIAQRLIRIIDLKSDEILARTGGNEFSICIPNISLEQAKAISHNIKQIIAQPLKIKEFRLNIECGLGIAAFPEHTQDINKLIQLSETAMYAAKAHRTGMNIYDKHSAQTSIERLKMAGDLREAIENNRIMAHYQPIINMRNPLDIRLEVLARWQHPESGPVSPETFIWLAEESGIINTLTSKIIKRSIEECGSLLETSAIQSISINISPHCLTDPEFPTNFQTLLKQHQVNPEKIMLEITESAMMTYTPKSQKIIQRIIDMGIKLAVDDFGTGHSSLYKLKQLPLAELKIDKTFVLELANKKDDAEIIKATIQMSHGLGLQTVAEGIEDKVSYEMLKSMGCDYAQGYHIARPMPFEKLMNWFKQYNPSILN